MIFAFLFISLTCTRKVFVSDYYKELLDDVKSDYGIKYNVYTVVENDLCTYTGGKLYGVSIGDLYFDENVKSIKMVATEAGGETTVVVSTFSDDACETQLQKTEMMTLANVKDKFNFEYKDFDQMNFAYASAVYYDPQCPHKNNILKNYVVCGCMSINTTSIKMAILLEKKDGKVMQTLYQNTDKCEGSGTTVPMACNYCVTMTVDLCKQQMQQMYANSPYLERYLETCEEMGDYGLYTECDAAGTGGNTNGSGTTGGSDKKDGSMSTFILAVLLLLAFLL